MATRISQLIRTVPELTSIVQGYTSPELLADQILPVVTVEEEVGNIRSFGKSHFRQYETKRALRADSNFADFEVSTQIPYKLDEYDLAIPIDYRELAADPNLKFDEANRTAQLLSSRFEKMLADTLQTTGTYVSGNSTTVAGGAEWNDPDSDILGQMQDGRSAINGKIAMNPNTALLSYDSYLALRNHPQFLEKIKYSQKAIITKELLAEFLEVEKVLVSEAMYTNSADAFVRMYSECGILMYIAPQKVASSKVPSLGYTLRQKGSPISGDYKSLNGKITYVGTSYLQQQIITCTSAGYLFKGTIA